MHCDSKHTPTHTKMKRNGEAEKQRLALDFQQKADAELEARKRVPGKPSFPPTRWRGERAFALLRIIG